MSEPKKPKKSRVTKPKAEASQTAKSVKPKTAKPKPAKPRRTKSKKDSSSGQSSEFKFTVLKDTREQKGWDFPEMKEVALVTGDYTLEGMQNTFVIERKASVAEIAQNITEERWERCLDRLAELPFAFLVLEFSVSDVLAWPKLMPAYQRAKVKLNGRYILKKLLEYAVNRNIRVIFAGSKGQEVARSIFKRMQEWQEKEISPLP